MVRLPISATGNGTATVAMQQAAAITAVATATNSTSSANATRIDGAATVAAVTLAALTAQQLAQQQQQASLTAQQQQQQQQLTTVPAQPRQPGLTAQQLQQQQAALTALKQQQAAQSTETPVISNKTIDMSPLNFNKVPSQPSSLTSTKMKEELSLQKPSPVPSEEPIQVQTVITDSIQSLSTSDHQLNSMDWNDFYHVIN